MIRRLTESGRDLNTLLVVCAYNEERTLPALLKSVTDQKVLVVDDGSLDGTREIVTKNGAALLIHSRRLGKSSSLQDAINYAIDNGYGTVVEVGADAVPAPDALSALLNALSHDDVGAASVWQVPVGPRNVAYLVDEVIWSLLNHGKRVQQALYGSCHTGGVMHAFKLLRDSQVSGTINDDEHLCLVVRSHGFRTTFVEDARVHFDASSSLGHILERRRRMILGHLAENKSSAPSMDRVVLALAIVESLRERPRRMIWILPAFVMEAMSRLLAWKAFRRPRALAGAKTWVTTYAKNCTLSGQYSTTR